MLLTFKMYTGKNKRLALQTFVLLIFVFGQVFFGISSLLSLNLTISMFTPNYLILLLYRCVLATLRLVLSCQTFFFFSPLANAEFLIVILFFIFCSHTPLSNSLCFFQHCNLLID